MPGLSYPGAVHYETVAAAYRDLERASARLVLIDRLAELLRQAPADLLPRVGYVFHDLSPGGIRNRFAGETLVGGG